MQGCGGGNWGSQMAVGAAREPEAQGEAVWSSVLSNHGGGTRAKVQSAVLLWAFFSSLPGSPFQETSRLAPGPGLLGLPHIPTRLPHLHLQFAPLQSEL